jgi:hypothetical protein
LFSTAVYEHERADCDEEDEEVVGSVLLRHLRTPQFGDEEHAQDEEEGVEEELVVVGFALEQQGFKLLDHIVLECSAGLKWEGRRAGFNG